MRLDNRGLPAAKAKMVAYAPRMRVFRTEKMVSQYDSHTMQEALYLCKGEKTAKHF